MLSFHTDWAWKGATTYFVPDVSIDAVNAALPPGSPITLSDTQKDPIDELELLLTNGRLSDETRAGKSFTVTVVIVPHSLTFFIQMQLLPRPTTPSLVLVKTI